jgi:two-component system, chemotaxis family, sensor kinase CheA
VAVRGAADGVQGGFMDDLLREFLTETNESLGVVDVELVRFEQEPNNAGILANIFRLVHTIKGTCGFLGLPRLEALAHAAESVMGKFRDGMPVTGEAVTVILFTIDRIKEILDELEKQQKEPEGTDEDLIGSLRAILKQPAGALASTAAPPPGTVGTLIEQKLERPLRPGEVSLDELERAFRETPGPAPGERSAASFAKHPSNDGKLDDESKVVNQSIRVNVDTLEQLMTMVSELVLTRNQLLEIVRRHDESEFKAPLQRLSSVTAELQEGVMKTRMQPVGNAWQKLPRVVRDLAGELGKQIELHMHGAETELDRQVLDLIKDPLTHMVRNAADHGLEMPQMRRAAGKPETGSIRLSAYHEGGYIIIQLADDGRGLATERIKAKAIANGLISQSEAEKMSEAQLQKLIFAPGFSTATNVTAVSGRGVGMDVVRTNIDQIGGTTDVHSVPGKGSTFTIKIPLTLAIISALIVEAGGHRFAIPQLSVIELVRARSNSEHRIERIKDAAVLRLRNKLLPLVQLTSLLGLEQTKSPNAGAGFIVVMQVGSEAFGVVVDAVFHTEEIVVKPMSTMLRHIDLFSGNTILGDGSVILIVDPNGLAHALGTSGRRGDRSDGDGHAQTGADADQSTSMLIFCAGSPQPKAVPLSLITRLEEIDAARVELSNGRHLLQYRGQLMPLVPINGDVQIKTCGLQSLLVFSDAGRYMGLMVDEIVDIVSEKLDIQVASDRAGILGSAIIKGQATEIIDLEHFLPLGFEDWFGCSQAHGSRRQRSVLLVDDSAFFRNMLTPVLKAAGYEVTTASGAEDALALLNKGRRFDVILTDIEMPGMSGFDLAQQVRGDPCMTHMPVIALSSMISPDAIERGREVGFHDYVAKFDRRGLIAALKEQTADVNRAA